MNRLYIQFVPAKIHNGEKTYLLRMSQADWIRWVADAERRGYKFSEWARECLNVGAGRIPVPEPKPSSPPARQPYVTPEPATPAREPDLAPPPGQVRSTTLESPPGGFMRMRETARDLAQRNGKCTADVARGTRCKLCGKIH